MASTQTLQSNILETINPFISTTPFNSTSRIFPFLSVQKSHDLWFILVWIDAVVKIFNYAFVFLLFPSLDACKHQLERQYVMLTSRQGAVVAFHIELPKFTFQFDFQKRTSTFWLVFYQSDWQVGQTLQQETI